MKNTTICFQSVLLFLCLSGLCQAQNGANADPPPNWQLMDLQKDSIFGTSVNKAYQELLKGKTAHTVIVAVIDKGMDTTIEDLKGHVWINTKEIPGNGIDDDHNGYIDDIHGWNFPSSRDGRNLENAGLEQVREYHRLKLVFASANDTAKMNAHQRKEYQNWLRVQQMRLEDAAKLTHQINYASDLIHRTTIYDSVLHTVIRKDSLFYADIDSLQSADPAVREARDSIKVYYNRYSISKSLSIENWIDGGNSFIKDKTRELANWNTNPYFERRQVVGDDPNDINNRNYGNNNISTGNPDHGSEVSGVIAAIRNNGIGMDGITDHVLIMSIRVNGEGRGDELDKDVALAIRYAVDNGARIINMSFGKDLSPNKYMVDDAVIHARDKGVLLVKAAGNDSHDVDSIKFFPTSWMEKEGKVADNLITVGASTPHYDSMLCARFSNYGAKEVDLFAPGVYMYMTAPGNKYISANGTSFASPTVAGIAALIWEYYPKLNYKQVRYCIEKSATPIDLMVFRPGSQQKVPFKSLSKTGGIVNAYQALLIADKLSMENKN